MAAFLTTNEEVKRKLYLQVSPHSVSIEFKPNAVSLSASLPPLYLRMTRGTRAAESTHAALQGGAPGSTTYTATWQSCDLPMNVALYRNATSGKYASKEIKFQLKIHSKERSHKSLASCTYDISCLNLSALDYVATSSETRQVSLNAGLSAAAAAAIHAITLEATFHYEFLQDNFEISMEQSRSRETSPRARSLSPSSPVNNADLTGSTVTDTPASHDTQSTVPTDSQQPDALPKPANESNGTDTSTRPNQEGINHHPHPESRPRVQSSPAHSGRPPKPPKKKFQWFKKIKGESKGRSASHEHSAALKAVPPPSSPMPSSGEPSETSHVESTGAVESLPTNSTIVKDTNHSQEKVQHNTAGTPEPNDGDPPPKPKRRSKMPATNASITPESPVQQVNTVANEPEENGSLNRTVGQQSEEPIHPHVPLTRLLPSQQKRQSISSDVSADDRTRSYSASAADAKRRVAQARDNRISLLSTSRESGHEVENKEGSEQSKATPKRYRPRSNSRPSLAPPPVVRARSGLSKHMFGSTPHISETKLAQGQRSSSVSLLAYQKTKSPRPSISDLIKPTAMASHTRSVENRIGVPAKPPSDDHLGILKVRLKAVDTSDSFQSHGAGKAGSAVDRRVESMDQPKPVKEGLHCIFTINGSNGRFTSSVQPLVPHRTTMWGDSDEVLFYATPQSKKLFVLCRRTNLESAGSSVTDVSQTKSSRRISQAQDDRCIGAAVLDISTVSIQSSPAAVNVCDYLAGVACEDHKLPVQPKGSMLLQSCLYVMQPRFKVSCTGTLTIQSLSGVHCNPEHDLSCTVKIDSNFQDDTTPQDVEECAKNGWSDEPVHFKAYCSLDCTIQIWAYSSEQTEYWCGGCTVPLAMLLPDKEVRRHALKGEEATDCALSANADKTITLPVEPKGVMTLSFSLVPSLRSRSQTPVTGESAGEDSTEVSVPPADSSVSPEPTPASPAPALTQPPSSRLLSKRGSLRRTTMKKAGNFKLRVLKSYIEEPFSQEEEPADLKADLEQQNTDLKKEIEFLREELRQTKAKLAESEFYREQAQLELKSLREPAQQANTKDKDVKSTKKTSKQNQQRK